MKCKLTSRGVAVGCAATGVLMVGFLLGDGVLITLGACGLLIFATAYMLAPCNLRDLELSVQLPPRFFAMRGVPAVAELHNRRRVFDARGVEITMRFGSKVERSGHAVRTLAQSSSLLRERVSMPARAVVSKVDYELRSTFPWGLFEARRSASCDCPFLVYPHVITPLELQLDGMQADPNPVSGISLGDLYGEPRGIRPYQPGDKAARIHQFATAHSISRGRGLQVRAFDPPGFHPDSCRIVFHSFAKKGEVIRLDRFERALSLVAGALALFQTNQTKVVFQADFANWHSQPCHSRAEYFETLAMLTRATRARRTEARDLTDVLQKVSAKEQLIIISDATPDNWSELIPPAHARAILVDIRQVRFKRPKVQIQLVKVP